MLIFTHDQLFIKRIFQQDITAYYGGHIGKKDVLLQKYLARPGRPHHARPRRETVSQEKLFHGIGLRPRHLPGIGGHRGRFTQGLQQMRQPMDIGGAGILGQQGDVVATSGPRAQVPGAAVGKLFDTQDADQRTLARLFLRAVCGPGIHQDDFKGGRGLLGLQRGQQCGQPGAGVQYRDDHRDLRHGRLSHD